MTKIELNKLGNKLFKLSRDCPKEYERILLEACIVLYNMEDEL